MIFRSVNLIASIAFMLVACGAWAQDYPSRPIRFYTGLPGGSNDAGARIIAAGITGPLGQPVIIENRNGILHRLTVAKAAPDGYALLYAGSNIGIAPLLEPMDYDAVRDFAPVVLTTSSPYLLIIHPSLPVKSVKELIALAKAKPGELNYGSSLPGSATHLAGELFKSMAKVNIYNIPSKAAAAAITSLMAGEVHTAFSSTGTGLASIKSGKAKALAVTSLEPSALVPGVPTVSDTGLPGYECIGFDGVFAPAKTPTPIINQLNREIVRFLNTPSAKEKFLGTGLEVIASPPETLGNKMKSEIATMGKLMKDIGLIKAK